MIVITGALTLLLAVQAASPADTATRSPCELTDNACKAKLFIQKSAKAPPAQRALYLFTAHRSYLALFAKTGQLRDLCAARDALDRSLAVPGQSAGQLASFEASRVELEALEKQHGARCGAKRRKTPEPTAVAKNGPTAVSPDRPAAVALEGTIAATRPSPALEPAAPEGLLAVPTQRRPVPNLRPDEPALAASPRPTLAAQPERPYKPGRAPTPGRPMIITGGTTLGLGLILAGVAGYAGSRVAEASRASFDLYDQNQGQGDAEALAEQTQLRNTFHRWVPVTIGTAIAGSAAVIVGAVLVRIGVRRVQPSRTAVVPVPGGLAIHARF
jgi:hypothetical protein